MPTLSYPGVYIEELSSGVHTITGVATSITAFIGRAAKGPINQATTITSFADFERTFGGVWSQSMLGYAVQDFYRNGGATAIIVRLYHAGAGATTAKLTPGNLPLAASSPGVWGNNLIASLDTNVDATVAPTLGVTPADLFNLTVQENVEGGAIETFRNLTVIESPRRFDRVLSLSSKLVAADAGDPYSAPAMPTPAANVTPSTAATPDAPLTMADDFLPATPKKGLFALDNTDLFNILCIPPYAQTASGLDVDTGLIGSAASYCEARRAMLVLDGPSKWQDAAGAASDMNQNGAGTSSKNAAVFFPRYTRPNTVKIDSFPVCGAVAGVFARTDTQRGVWKAPAGLDATVLGASDLLVHLTDAENGLLNPLGINCLRTFAAAGQVVWGSRTLQGDDRLASQWKYIPVRRTALYIEESLYRGTQWVVFEPNDEPLWSQIRLNIGAFMNSLFRQGAFQGKTPAEAYFVKCDKETTTQADIDLGIVNIVVGFAPLKPAEFVVISIQQIAGQTAA
jgi:phage tail sheath protein FI